jgi:hypothetical protein
MTNYSERHSAGQSAENNLPPLMCVKDSSAVYLLASYAIVLKDRLFVTNVEYPCICELKFSFSDNMVHL